MLLADMVHCCRQIDYMPLSTAVLDNCDVQHRFCLINHHHQTAKSYRFNNTIENVKRFVPPNFVLHLAEFFQAQDLANVARAFSLSKVLFSSTTA
jgi:hypothetical protein